LMHTEGSLRAVLDTSSIIVLARLGVLEDAITKIFAEIEIPRGVLIELERKKDEVYHTILDLVERGLIKIEEVVKRFPRLGMGESSAIFTALEKNEIVVLDDKRARKFARELGLEVLGTLSILRRLYEVDALRIDRYKLYIKLIEMGFYIKKEVFDKVFPNERER